MKSTVCHHGPITFSPHSLRAHISKGRQVCSPPCLPGTLRPCVKSLIKPPCHGTHGSWVCPAGLQEPRGRISLVQDRNKQTRGQEDAHGEKKPGRTKARSPARNCATKLDPRGARAAQRSQVEGVAYHCVWKWPRSHLSRHRIAMAVCSPQPTAHLLAQVTFLGRLAK